jgi:hypothetical protein
MTMPSGNTTNNRLFFIRAVSKNLRQVKSRTSIGIGSLGSIFCLIVTLFIASPALAEEEIDIGRTAAGQLKVVIGFTPPLELEPSIFPGISGYATGLMGLHSIFFDDPTNDFFQLSPAADFRFILLAKDPGMEVWNDTGSGYLGIGQSFYIGPPIFDTHPIWNIVTGTAGNVYSLTLKLHDVTGVYPDSAPFVLSFTPQVPPGSGPYQINLTLADPLHATLWWTTNAVGWELQSADSVATGNWATVTNVPDIAGTNFSLSITPVDSQKFFRLHKQ